MSEHAARHTAQWQRLCLWASGRNTLILLVGVLSFNLILMGAMVDVGSELPIDLRLFYTPQEVQAQADAIAARGPVGWHIAKYLLLDTPYPLLYTALLVFALTWALQRGPWARQSSPPRVLLLPIGALLFDYAENLAMVFTLWVHPRPLPTLAWAMSAVTALKWFFVLLSVLMLLMLLALAAAQRMKSSWSRT